MLQQRSGVRGERFSLCKLKKKTLGLKQLWVNEYIQDNRADERLVAASAELKES